MEQAGAPEYTDGRLILTYMASKPVRYVAARFAHEDFRVLHIYRRNKNQVFFLVYPVPKGCGDLEYRIVVDGLWMRDPFNPSFVPAGTLDTDYSVCKVKHRPRTRHVNPTWEDSTRVRLAYRGDSGQMVSLIGDFNNWDPFRHPLIEDREDPGTYTIRLPLGPGRHHYVFMVDGVRVPDPLNPEKTHDKNGRQISYFDTPPSSVK